MKEINNSYNKKNESIIIECLRISSDGSGVGYDQEGKATFIPGMLPGEKGQVLVTERKKSWQRAQLLSLENEVKERMNPPCPVFEVCGGCQLQHLDYAETLKWKESWVRDALERIGKINLEHVNVYPTLGMEEPWRYRNKVRLHRSASGELGYYQEKSRETVEFPDCLLISESMNEWVRKIRDGRKETSRPLVNALDKIRNITFRENSKGDGMIIFDSMSMTDIPPEILVSLKEVMSADPKIQSVWGINHQGVPELLWGQEFLTEEILGLTFNLSPLAFLQVNPLQTQKLYSTVLDWTNITEESQVWDLYSGIGTITLALAQRARKVWGIEENPYAVEDAKINADLNHISNAEFLQGKVEDVLLQIPQSPDIVVLDPPRAGVHSRVLNSLIEVKPERIIYVSCDPGTLARDAGILQRAGYFVKKVQPVDMFPWTQHVETVVLIERK
ncbi:23S rRNA (uracil(1939)-C(5))-methyltransferase RlmD [Desulfitobacterium metallireducens]|uniref:23S rRNA methyltransferase n=1 Tax=Desulfitobacterium metallireducens DSM 15288 TaxID=871968 RepID=W0EB47_9FIRM|nr:23S rRNA (uracil(1939)-C(5))-methyltransferase RlmD [Desulfitobacterium metallireducens]AHF06444.1 23S rRNA methyltransferase [Desulfitobacterium metallireducens DSM 15288]